MQERHFPILEPASRGRSSVPWGFVEQCREQAMANHHQTLERLAERGGLSWAELYMCLTRQRWRGQTISEGKASAAVLAAFDWIAIERNNLTAEKIETLKRVYERD